VAEFETIAQGGARLKLAGVAAAPVAERKFSRNYN